MWVDNLPDFYRLLHVYPEAPVAVIKASYRAMMQKMRLHPDLGGDAALAQQLNEAVATLCDASKRWQYDALRSVMDNRANHTEPGGTPSARAHSKAHNNTSDNTQRHSQNQYDQAHAHHESAQGSRGFRHSNASATRDTVLLPVKPHCPFCKAVYSANLADVKASSANVYDNTRRCYTCHGAATTVNKLIKTGEDDLRAMYRHDHTTPVLIWTHWPTDAPVTARMTDLSIVGCALESNARLAAGTVVLLDSPLLNGIGKVRYSQPCVGAQSFSAGLEFLTLQITAEPGAVFSVTA